MSDTGLVGLLQFLREAVLHHPIEGPKNRDEWQSIDWCPWRKACSSLSNLFRNCLVWFPSRLDFPCFFSRTIEFSFKKVSMNSMPSSGVSKRTNSNSLISLSVTPIRIWSEGRFSKSRTFLSGGPVIRGLFTMF